MMYIVLTAMLALNVAAEVLEAFKLVDASLIHTLESVDMKNEQVYSSFEQAYIENPAKVEEWKQKADQVRKNTVEMISYVDQLKEDLVNYSGSRLVSAENPYNVDKIYYITQNNDTLEIKKQDDLNGPSEMMITQKRGTELKEKIIAFRNDLVTHLDDDNVELVETILKELETPDPPRNIKEGSEIKTWESQYFENKPLIAVLTVLSKMQIDVKNSEANTIEDLYAQIDAGSFKFNKLGARVIANSNLVFQGETYEAEVFLAAEDTTQQPIITIQGRPAEVVDGKATYTVNTNEAGVFTWSGLIKYKTPAGVYRDYPFEQEYQVTEPSVTMSATNMNVFYRGLKNPFDVGGGGIAKENLEVEMTNGTVVKTGNTYIIEPDELDELSKKTKVSVYANIGGQRRLVGSSDWRVKKVPDPVAQVALLSGGEIRKEVLQIQDGVMAVLVDFDFDFKYKVTSFEVQTTEGSYVTIKKSESNRFTAEQKILLERANPQSVVYIGNIKAIGDDGDIRNLNPISFTIR